MLRKAFHGRRIKQEIRKLTAIRSPSPNLNPVLESPGSPTRPTPLTSLSPLPPLFFYGQNLPPTSHFRFTHQVTKFPVSTGALATGRSSAAYCSRARKPDPNNHLEDPNLNVESLRENGSVLRRTPPEERGLIFTGPSEDGEGCVYMVLEKHLSQELCGEGERALCVKPVSANAMEWRDCPMSSALEVLKRNPELVNKLELHPGVMYHMAMEEIRKHGRMVVPLSEKVAYEPKIHLGRGIRVAYEEGIRVAYEEAMQYVVQFVRRHFPLTVAVCETSPLEAKIVLIESSIYCESTDALIGPTGCSVKILSTVASWPGTVAAMDPIWYRLWTEEMK